MDEQAVIAGCAEATYTRHPPLETTTARVLAQVALEALQHAQIDADELDGLVVSSFSLGPDNAIDLAWRLGLQLRWLLQDTNGGASGVNMSRPALAALAWRRRP